LKAILGIGNPGIRYELTRHNIGFIILDLLAEKHRLQFKPSKGNFLITKSELHASPFFLIKPTTYVNRSGIAALDLFDELKINIEDFLVVTDDVNLELGKIRIRLSGGDGGHNGIRSIIYHLKRDDFPRIRFGIGEEFPKGDMADYVLSKITDDEITTLKPRFNFIMELIERFIVDGTGSMLNHYSQNIHPTNDFN
jgi:PTH1 family peptidyl-tRNA hydrolase